MCDAKLLGSDLGVVVSLESFADALALNHHRNLVADLTAGVGG
jgi:hypothetical protein